MLSQDFLQRLLNVSLRTLSLVSRFVMLFALAYMLTPADIGLYGLMTATIGFSVLVIGGDFYAYSQRELMSHPKEEWGFILQHQGVAAALLYVVLLPLNGLVFVFKLLPDCFILWFFILLISEHLAQELYRLLVAMQRPITASCMLFVRMGLWVWVLLPVMWFAPTLQKLETVFFAWFIGSMFSCVAGIVIVWREVGFWKWYPVDWKWLRIGYKKGLMFLVGTICFRALFTADRYIIKHYVGMEMLGVYVLYMSMAMAIVNFMEPAIFSFLYPRLVSAWRQGQHAIYKKVFRELSFSAIMFSIGLAVACAVLAPLVLQWTGKSIYIGQQHLLWVLLVMVVIYAIGMVPHYGLYAFGADRIIMLSHLSSLGIFILMVALMVGTWPFFAVPLALIGSFSWMGGVKLWFYLRLKNNHEVAVVVAR